MVSIAHRLFSHSKSTNNSTEDKYITSKYSGDGKVRVINQEQGIYDKDAPRSGDASAQHYKESSKHRSSHKHKR